MTAELLGVSAWLIGCVVIGVIIGGLLLLAMLGAWYKWMERRQ